MDNFNIEEYKYDFSNFKQLLNKFEELTTHDTSTLSNSIILLKELYQFQNDIIRINKYACLEYALNDTKDNKDHIQLATNLLNRIFGLRESLFNTLLLNYSEEDALSIDPELTNLIKYIYHLKPHYIDINDNDYLSLVNKLDILRDKVKFNKLSLEELKNTTNQYVSYNCELSNKLGFKILYERELFISDLPDSLIEDILTIDIPTYTLKEDNTSITLSNSMEYITNTFAEVFNKEYLEVYMDILKNNSIYYQSKNNIGTYSSFQMSPKILVKYENNMDSLENLIFELGNAISISEHNKNNLYDYEYNISLGNILGYINNFALHAYLKNHNLLEETSKNHLSKLINKIKNNQEILRKDISYYYDTSITMTTNDLLNIYNDFNELYDILEYLLAGYIYQELSTNKISKEEYFNILSITGNLSLKDILLKLNIEINKETLTNGLNYILEMIK